MPIEFESNICARCHKSDNEVGKIKLRKEHKINKYLCSKCFEKAEKPYTAICPKCKRVAHEYGGMSAYGERPPFEDMCVECVEKKEKRVAKRNALKLKIKNFLIKNWRFWIGTAIALIVGFGLLS